MTLLQTDRNLGYVFQVLARCPKTSDEAAKQRITDTIVYQHGSLRVWYYTEPDSGEVLRRDRREWSVDRIVEVFSSSGGNRKASPGVPIAFYVHFAAARSNQQGSGLSLKGAERVIDLATKYCRQYGDDAEPLSVDYFDEETLKAFLATRENKHNVILQKLIRGRADHASMIQVVWSPHRTLATQRQNTHSITDVRVPLYQRTNTFDNTTHLSHEIRPTAVMSARLDVECRRIVEHIAAVEQRVVIRLVAFFAFDYQQEAVMLFVSELQLTSQPATSEQVRLALSTQMKRKLCMISPQIIPSDVVFPSYAKVGGDAGSGGSPKNFASAAMGGANLSVKESSTKSTTISGQLLASNAATFDDEMNVLDRTFASAYEARSDRGRLTDEAYRRDMFGRDVFTVHHASAASWQDFEETQRRKDHHRSYLKAGKRFYTPDPLLGRGAHSNVSRPSSAMQQHSSIDVISGATTPPMSNIIPIMDGRSTRPTSAASQHHHTQHRSASSMMRTGHPKYRPTSSLVLRGEVRFCKGGGGGLFLRVPPAGGRSASAASGGDSVGDDGSERWGNASANGDMFSSFSTDALASLRSPPHSPNKRASPSGMPMAALSMAQSVAMFESTSTFDASSWIAWRRCLKAAAWYRRMVAATQGSYHSLSSGSQATHLSDNEIALKSKLDEIREDPASWVEVELPDLTVCPLEKLREATYQRNLPNQPMQSSMRTLNAWHLLHPSIGRDWALWSAEVHRATTDGIECLMAEVDRVFHTTSTNLGGLPSCDVKLPVAIEICSLIDHSALDSIRRHYHPQSASPLHKGKHSGGSQQHLSSSLAASMGEGERDGEDPPVRLPWWLSAWMLWSLVHPSQTFPPPQLNQLLREKATMLEERSFRDNTNESTTPSPCQETLHEMCNRAGGAGSTRVFDAAQCSSLLRWVLVELLGDAQGRVEEVAPTDLGGSDRGSPRGGLSSSPSVVVHLTLRLRNVSAEYLHRVQSSLRTLLASVSASWGLHGLVALHTIEQLMTGARRNRIGTPQSNGSSRVDALRKNIPSTSTNTVTVGHNNASVSAPLKLLTPESFIDSGSASFEQLVLSKQEWDVLQSTCSAALDERSKTLEASRFEWPPRMTFTR